MGTNATLGTVAPSFEPRYRRWDVTYAKTNPGKLSFASTGNGSTPHICAELFKTMTGIDMVHVPYRGSPQAVTDLIGGQVQVMFDIMAATIGYIRTGKVRALAVTTAARQDVAGHSNCR